jgi:hypothetical protein
MESSDGPTPPPCARDIYENGTVAWIGEGAGSNRNEAWVRALAAVTGQRCDWHFSGGRVVVMVAPGGDVARVNHFAESMQPLLGKLRAESGPAPQQGGRWCPDGHVLVPLSLKEAELMVLLGDDFIKKQPKEDGNAQETKP